MKRLTVLILTVYLVSALLFCSSISLARKGKWTEKTPLLVPRFAHTAPVVNGKIYVIGGANGNIFSFVDEYNPKADRWRKKADAPGARARSTASVVNGKIYVIGGLARRGHVYVVDMYNPVADIWTKKADMLTQRDGFSAGVVNGKIYVIGGGKWHNNGPGGYIGLSTVEEYDPVTNRWTKKADMPTKRVFFATGVVRGKIYAIGGARDKQNGKIPERREVLKTVEVYDPITDTWAAGTDMPTARWSLSASVINGRIYVLGGHGEKGDHLSTMEVYDPIADKWTQLDEMPGKRVSFSTSVVNGRIYAIGGGRGNLNEGAITLVSEYDTGFRGRAQSVNPAGKLATTWAQIKGEK